MIFRSQLKVAERLLFKQKAVIIYGPRQAGKTTFTEMLLKRIDRPTIKLNGDDFDIREMLSKPNSTLLKNIIGEKEILFIDSD